MGEVNAMAALSMDIVEEGFWEVAADKKDGTVSVAPVPLSSSTPAIPTNFLSRYV